MPEWLVERGIGETRFALVDAGEIMEARIAVDGIVSAGSILAARLVDAGLGGRNAIARDDAGLEYLLPAGAKGHSEGATVWIEVTRAQIPGVEKWKRPLARLADQPSRGADPAEITPAPRDLPFPAPRDELAEARWYDLLDQARSGIVRFEGGELTVSPTPAMTLIDVDGWLPPAELAVAGARAAAQAIRRLDVGGSIGIDLPTASGKEPRLAAATAIDGELPPPFERTAVNGFGFVQIVRPRRHASLIELAADKAAFEARALLRRTAFETPGPKRLVCHPAVAAVLGKEPLWLEALARQVGGAVGLRPDAALPMSGGYAESL